jgi:hypothetical protein
MGAGTSSGNQGKAIAGTRAAEPRLVCDEGVDADTLSRISGGVPVEELGWILGSFVEHNYNSVAGVIAVL